MAENIPNKWKIIKDIGSDSAVEISSKNEFSVWNM
jgi:hypothetical protein